MANRIVQIVGDTAANVTDAGGRSLANTLVPLLANLTGDTWSFQTYGAIGAVLVDPAGAAGYSMWGVDANPNYLNAITSGLPFDFCVIAFGTDDLTLRHDSADDLMNLSDALSKLLAVHLRLTDIPTVVLGVISGAYLGANAHYAAFWNGLMSGVCYAQPAQITPASLTGTTDTSSTGFDGSTNVWSAANMYSACCQIIRAYKAARSRTITF